MLTIKTVTSQTVFNWCIEFEPNFMILMIQQCIAGKRVAITFSKYTIFYYKLFTS